jgi:hypothetical protein
MEALEETSLVERWTRRGHVGSYAPWLRNRLLGDLRAGAPNPAGYRVERLVGYGIRAVLVACALTIGFVSS